MQTEMRKTDPARLASATRAADFDDNVASVDQRYSPSVFVGGSGSDSSWRFVIVAAVLFGLFLLLFALSKWLR